MTDFITPSDIILVGDGIYIDADGTYLHWVTDPDSGATYLDELSIGPRTAPVSRELPRRPA